MVPVSNSETEVVMLKDKTIRIRDLNDAFRKSFSGGRVMCTAGVINLPEAVRGAVNEAVRNFDEFSADNDPHGEHDFGSVEVEGQRFFWKIDYYDLTMEFGSEDPSDPNQTTRVMTILMAHEF